VSTRSVSLSRPRRQVGGALPVLVAVLTLTTLELVRASGPLVDLALTRAGVPAAALTALVTYLAPGPAAALLLLAVRPSARTSDTSRSVLLLGAVLLAGLRLLVQGLRGDARFVVGLVTVAVAVAVLSLAVAVLAAHAGGGRTAAGAVAAGAATAVGLQLALGTWDAFWRHTLLGWAVVSVVVAALVGAALLTQRDQAGAAGVGAGRLWALGPLLALAAMMLANPAFAASQSGLPLALAGPLQAVGLLLAGWVVLGRRSRGTGSGAVLLPLGVTGGLTLGGVFAGDGAVVLVALLLAQVAAVRLLGSALEPAVDPPPPGPVPPVVAATASLVGVATIAPLLVYQVDYDVPLGVPNELVLILTAVALGLGGLRPSAGLGDATARGRGPRGLLAGACAVVLLGTGAVAAGWLGNGQGRTAAAAQSASAGSGVVLSWNLHYGVTPEGAVDLETVARTIEGQDPDVVLLQEVSRGWVQGGGVEMATWLANRLGYAFAFAPAADRRFGNVILAREAPVAAETLALPYGQGPQHRSALAAQVRVGSAWVQVTSVHLQHRPANTPTRVRELETLLDELAVDDGRRVPMVVGGDLNAGPGDPEPALLTAAGFVSAVDAVGTAQALSDPTTGPSRRIDWVFGRGVGFRSARFLDTRASDHLPVVVRTDR
jgi:endonuclease/exonuclease/phosphatase family metal-dependent hydrolase